MAQRRALVPGAPPQCIRAMALGGGASRPLMAFASVRPSDNAPVLAIFDAERVVEASAAEYTSRPVLTQNRNDEAKAGAVAGLDGGRGRRQRNDLVVARAEDRVLLDVEGVSPWLGAGLVMQEEVELSVRCCSKSVVSGEPHAVWINPCEVKAFVSHGGGGGASAARGDVEGGKENLFIYGVLSVGDVFALACSAVMLVLPEVRFL